MQRHGGSKIEWKGKKGGVLINMASGRSVISLILSPTLLSLSTPIAHTQNTNLPNKQCRKDDSKQDKQSTTSLSQ